MEILQLMVLSHKMKNKKIIVMMLLFFLQIILVNSATDKLIKVSFVINDKDHIDLERFEVIEGEYKKFVESPTLYSLQIKSKKGEVVEKTNFAPAFFILSQANKLIKLNQTTISREFLYKGDKWKFLEIYKEDKLLFQADVEEKFCEETKLCNRWVKTLLYVVSIIIILLSLAYLFIRKKNE